MRTLLCFAVLVLSPGLALAHRASDSLLALVPEAYGFRGHWDIAPADLDFALGLDDGDGILRWGEVRTRELELTRMVLSSLVWATPRGACAARPLALQWVSHSDGSYLRLPFEVNCPESRTASVDMHFLADLDRDHRAIVRVGDAAESRVQVLSRAQPRLLLERSLAAPALANAAFADAIRRGARHIFEGTDHILFLLVLLLPTVLRRSGEAIEAETSIRPVLRHVTKIVTAFTAAHSLTLSLAALHWMDTSADVIEPAIAGSVALAALFNLTPWSSADGWALAFALGLLHGFGFASGLVDAGLQGRALALSLFGFNLGVELGQLVIVTCFLPLAFFMRRTRAYRIFVLPLGSLAVLAVSMVWFFQRLQTG